MPTPTQVCAECGHPLPANAPDGMCPHCLLQLGDSQRTRTGSDMGATMILPDAGHLLHSERPGQRIGRYKLLEEIGQGGFGAVWMAEQEEPVRRRVALKVIKLGMDTKEVIARFEAERQALAMMDHPNIARVFDGGATEAGRPYFVMELVRGVPMTQWCDARHLGTRERLELFSLVCQAVQHAHQKGVIHRDIKPSNILVTEQDGRAMPKVIDFGIAKATDQRLTEKTLFTGFNQIIGTPAYMSPEQAGLGGLDIDTRSDVYSLGVLLYALLTGSTPFDTQSLMKAGYDALLKTIRETEPPKPSTRLSGLSEIEKQAVAERRGEAPQQIHRAVRGDLDWIVMKALEKDRARRYETANALAADLRRFLDHQPVTAAPPSLGYQFKKFAGRNRVALVTSAAFVAVLVAGIAVSLWQAVRATTHATEEGRQRTAAVKAKADAESHARRAEENLATARRNLYFADMNIVAQSVAGGYLLRAHEVLDRYLPKPDEPDLRGWEWYYFRHEARDQSVFTFPPHEAQIDDLAFAPDGQTLVTAAEGKARFWDWESRTLKQTFTNGTTMVRFSATNREIMMVYRGMNTNAVGHFFRWPDMQKRARVPAAMDAAYSLKDGSFAAAALLLRRDKLPTREVSYMFWSYAPGAVKPLEWTLPNLGISYGIKLAISPDGAQMALAGFPGFIRIVHTDGSTNEFEIPVNDQMITALAWSPDGRWLAAGSGYRDHLVRVWDTQDRFRMHTLRAHLSWVTSLAFTPDGSRLVSASTDQTACIWRMQPLQLQNVLRGHQHEVWRVAISPHGSNVVTGSKGGEVKVWPIVAPVNESNRFVVQVSQKENLSDDNTRYLTLYNDGAARGITWGKHAPVNELGTSIAGGPDDSPSRLALSPDARRIAAAVRGELRLWQARGRGINTIVTNLQAYNCKLTHLAFLGDLLVSVSESNQVKTWNMSLEQQSQWQLPEATNWRRILIQPALSALIYEGRESLTIVELSTGEVRATIAAPRVSAIEDSDVSRDGRWLAVGDEGSNVYLIDPATWELKAHLRGHSHAVFAVAFSPDGKRLLTAGGNRSPLLWDVESRQEICELPILTDRCTVLHFAPDGRSLAVGRTERELEILPVPDYVFPR